jgi:hypothetical protein
MRPAKRSSISNPVEQCLQGLSTNNNKFSIINAITEDNRTFISPYNKQWISLLFLISLLHVSTLFRLVPH